MKPLVGPLVVALRALLRRVFVVAAVLGAASARSAPPTSEAGASPEAVRSSVARALPLLAKGAEGHMAERKCFACHHQTLPLLALATAGRRGFPVDRDYVERMASFVERSLESGRARYLEGRGQGGNTITAGYALWTLRLAGRKPSDTTAMVAAYLASAHKDGPHWRVTTQRPPSEASHFASTFVALRGLQAYAGEEGLKAVAPRLDDVRAWLLKTPAKDTEDRVFRLWALRLLDADRAAVDSARDELLAKQRSDGGWSQRPDTHSDDPSDAYATGAALVALRETGALAPVDLAYRRGLAYLIRTQQPDGSWHVKSRSKPFQTYFETGFPHGTDQFISSAASGWAATALALALPAHVDPD